MDKITEKWEIFIQFYYTIISIIEMITDTT